MYGLRSIFLFGFTDLPAVTQYLKDTFVVWLTIKSGLANTKIQQINALSQGGYFRLEVSSINPVDW